MLSPKEIAWMELESILDEWLLKHLDATLVPLATGSESEVFLMGPFALKFWQQEIPFDIDVKAQYLLLQRLHEHELPVPQAVGWGIHCSGRHVMVTMYAGQPVNAVNDEDYIDS